MRVEFVFHRHDIALVSISLASGWDSVVQRRDAVRDLLEKVVRQGAFGDCVQVFGQMRRVAGADDSGGTVRVSEGVSQDQFGAIHAIGKDFIDFRLRPYGV